MPGEAHVNCTAYSSGRKALVMHALCKILSDPTSRFSLYITDRFGNDKAQKANFRPKNNTKNYTYLSSIFNPNIWSKIKVCIYSKSQGQTLASDWHLCSHRFLRAWPSLAYLKLPRSRPKRILGNSAVARAENSSSFHFIVFTVLPEKYPIHWIRYCSKLARIGLVGPGIHPQNGQRDNFTRWPPTLLHSTFGDSVGMKPPLTSVFFQRLASTHSPAWWCQTGGFCSSENGSKKHL